jgi:hypothetical protein
MCLSMILMCQTFYLALCFKMVRSRHRVETMSKPPLCFKMVRSRHRVETMSKPHLCFRMVRSRHRLETLSKTTFCFNMARSRHRVETLSKTTPYIATTLPSSYCNNIVHQHKSHQATITSVEANIATTLFTTITIT